MTRAERGSSGLALVAFGALLAFAAPARAEAPACETRVLDADGMLVDPGASHASISTTLPAALAREVTDARDEEALTFVVVCPRGPLPRTIRIESRGAEGGSLDALERVPVEAAACDPGSPGECAKSPAIRATSDWADRAHPASALTSIRAEVGGEICIFAGAGPPLVLRVGGPRKTRLGPIERMRARLAVHVLRQEPGGPSALGRTEQEAREVVQAEVERASMVWGQCGIHFGPPRELSVDLVDPPPHHLLAVGCQVGLPASGGEIRIAADNATFRVVTYAGESPTDAAVRVARALSSRGYHAVVAPNARVPLGARRTADVLVRRKDGTLANLVPVGEEPVSTDRTLPVCIGHFDAASGLGHFEDQDAVSGTLEERTLVKAYVDSDPTTIDVFVVPSFAKTGRIGESFIDSDGSGIQNVVIVDRLAVLSGSRTYALPHELGHVLLDLPGHPDDFGVDRPWSLMDSDSSDPGIYGPRRLSVEDCERAIRQSGPGSAVPLLTPWPLSAKPERRGEIKPKR